MLSLGWVSETLLAWAVSTGQDVIGSFTKACLCFKKKKNDLLGSVCAGGCVLSKVDNVSTVTAACTHTLASAKQLQTPARPAAPGEGDLQTPEVTAEGHRRERSSRFTLPSVGTSPLETRAKFPRNLVMSLFGSSPIYLSTP